MPAESTVNEQPTSPPELKALMEALDRATDPIERQRAWDALVNYQREHGTRAQPRGAEEAPN